MDQGLGLFVVSAMVISLSGVLSPGPMTAAAITQGSRSRITETVVFAGGVAKNTGVVRALEEQVGMKLEVPYDPQITGALGAAIIAANSVKVPR